MAERQGVVLARIIDGRDAARITRPGDSVPASNTRTVATTARRSGPLSLRIGTSEVTLLASDVGLLIATAESWAAGVSQRGWEQRHARPQNLQSSERLLEAVGALTETLAVTPSQFGDPPLELDHGQLELLRRVMAELTGYQRGTLTPPLRSLEAAVAKVR